jgi:hypothetical protein
MDKARDPDRIALPASGMLKTGPFRYPLASFVGRERELDEIRSLFREGKQLVTVTGVGGTGKTCLALQLRLNASDLGDVPRAGSL